MNLSLSMFIKWWSLSDLFETMIKDTFVVNRVKSNAQSKVGKHSSMQVMRLTAKAVLSCSSVISAFH